MQGWSRVGELSIRSGVWLPGRLLNSTVGVSWGDAPNSSISGEGEAACSRLEGTCGVLPMGSSLGIRTTPRTGRPRLGGMGDLLGPLKQGRPDCVNSFDPVDKQLLSREHRL